MSSLFNELKFDQPAIELGSNPVDLGELMVSTFLAPWVVCRFAFGQKYLRYLFSKADLVGRDNLLKNRNVSAELLYEVVVDEKFGLNFTDYGHVVNHRNCSGETVAYLLRDSGLRFMVSRQLGSVKKGLHFLRDSGDEKDYALYLDVMVNLLLFSSPNLTDITFLDPEDIGNLLGSPVEDGSFPWRYEMIAKTFLNEGLPKAYLDEFAAGKLFPLNHRETAYKLLSELDGFNPDGLPDSWVRKTYGLDGVAHGW